MVLVSFVVPVYKVKKEYFLQCIDSLQSQNTHDIEIIIVDDGTTEEILNICKKLEKSDNRIRVIYHGKNKGVSVARNTGIRESIGKWICFVDSDDWIEKDTCTKLLNYIAMEEKEPDIVFCSGYVNYGGKEVLDEIETNILKYSKLEGSIEKKQIDVLTYIRKGNPNRVISPESINTKFFNRTLFSNEDLWMPIIPHREDSLFLQMAMERASRIIEIPERIYHYRMNSGSAVNSYREESPREQQMYLSMLWKFCVDYGKGESFIEAYYISAFLSMQIVITNYFFNTENKDSWFVKQKKCKDYFSQKPYCDVFKNIPIFKLKNNHIVKAFCIRLHFYRGLNILRRIYYKIHQNEDYC